jgi:hypothetical protein
MAGNNSNVSDVSLGRVIEAVESLKADKPFFMEALHEIRDEVKNLNVTMGKVTTTIESHDADIVELKSHKNKTMAAASILGIASGTGASWFNKFFSGS